MRYEITGGPRYSCPPYGRMNPRQYVGDRAAADDERCAEPRSNQTTWITTPTSHAAAPSMRDAGWQACRQARQFPCLSTRKSQA